MTVNYARINAAALNAMLAVKKHLPAIDAGLKALIELRVSQINGCPYCIDLHANEARAAGESQQKLDCLMAWQDCGLFSEAEMAALAWADDVTLISTETEIETKLTALLEHYSEAEVVDLTVIISLMNSLNRMAISFGDKPMKREGAG